MILDILLKCSAPEVLEPSSNRLPVPKGECPHPRLTNRHFLTLWDFLLIQFLLKSFLILSQKAKCLHHFHFSVRLHHTTAETHQDSLASSICTQVEVNFSSQPNQTIHANKCLKVQKWMFSNRNVHQRKSKLKIEKGSSPSIQAGGLSGAEVLIKDSADTHAHS